MLLLVFTVYIKKLLLFSGNTMNLFLPQNHLVEDKHHIYFCDLQNLAEL